MSLLDRIAPTSASATFECPKYRPLPGMKRCQHYVDGGACALPDELMCVEWLKANGQAMPHPTPTPVQVTPPPVSPPTDLFGTPVATPSAKAAAKKKPATTTPSTEPPAGMPPVAGEPIPRISEQDIASFKALGVEVCLSADGVGEVWIVPEYTGKDRKELSVEHAATLRLVVDAFPGAKVIAFEKLRATTPPQEKEPT